MRRDTQRALAARCAGAGRGLACGVAALLALGLSTAGGLAQTLQARVSGPPALILDSFGRNCGGRVMPDAPPRAFVDAQGQVVFFAADEGNRALRGRSLHDLALACPSTLRGAQNADPDSFDDHAWVAALFTRDGRQVWGLVHNEFHGQQRPVLCPSRVYERCWENALVRVASGDGGKTFTRDPGPGAVVAALPEPYQGDRPKQVGYFNPTNVIEAGGFFYVMAGLIPLTGKSGLCLMRAPVAEGGRPGSWKGFDGQDFTVDVRGRAAGATNLCTPLPTPNLFFGVGSLSIHRPSGLFVATMRFNRWDKPRNGEVPGVYLSTSRDLLTWSPPVLLLADRDVAPPEDPKHTEYYPVLMDDAAHDRTFQEIGDDPLLITTQTSRSRPSWQRRLVSRPIHLDLALP
jgi:hypothetical protein